MGLCERHSHHYNTTQDLQTRQDGPCRPLGLPPCGVAGRRDSDRYYRPSRPNPPFLGWGGGGGACVFWMCAGESVRACVCGGEWVGGRTTRMRPFAMRSLIARRASEPFTRIRSEMIEAVISLNLGTSFTHFSYRALSKKTALATFSLTLPLDHFCSAGKKMEPNWPPPMGRQTNRPTESREASAGQATAPNNSARTDLLLSLSAALGRLFLAGLGGRGLLIHLLGWLQKQLVGRGRAEEHEWQAPTT